MTSQRFKETSDILNECLKGAAAGKSRRKAALAIANTLGISLDAIESWRRGTRCIPEEQIVPFVRALERLDDTANLTLEGMKLVKALTAARKKAEVRRSWQEQIEEGGITLRVHEAAYAGAGHLWSRIVHPFLDAACITYDLGTGRDRRQHFHQLQAALWNGKVHLALGILSTPRLSLRLSFFNAPVTYRLNAVVLDVGPNLQRIRDLLARRASQARHQAVDDIGPSRVLHPVVMSGEIGEAYVTHNLKITDVIGIQSLDAASYCSKLRVPRRGRDSRIRIAVADEITCLSILRLLGGQGSLVFPLIPDGSDARALIPPSFALGIATSRNEHLPHVRSGALRVLTNEALKDHIQGNARSIAFSYLALRNKIRRLVDQAVPDAPVAVRDEWTARTFRIGDALESWRLEPAHWRAVLREAMSLTHAGNSFSAPLAAGPQQYVDNPEAQDDLM